MVCHSCNHDGPDVKLAFNEYTYLCSFCSSTLIGNVVLYDRVTMPVTMGVLAQFIGELYWKLKE
jgi:hypothetical protein